MLCLINLDVWGRYRKSMILKIICIIHKWHPLKIQNLLLPSPYPGWGILDQRPALLGFHFQLQHTTSTTIPPCPWLPKNKTVHSYKHTPTHVRTHTHTYTHWYRPPTWPLPIPLLLCQTGSIVVFWKIGKVNKAIYSKADFPHVSFICSPSWFVACMDTDSCPTIDEHFLT